MTNRIYRTLFEKGERMFGELKGALVSANGLVEEEIYEALSR